MELIKSYEDQLTLEVEKRRMAVELIKRISDLWYENNIELQLFRNQLIDRNVSQILNLIDYSKEFVQKPISIFQMAAVAQKVEELDLPPSKIDLGKLTYLFHLTGDDDLDAFITKKLSGAKNGHTIQPKDVVLYGFDHWAWPIRWRMV